MYVFIYICLEKSVTVAGLCIEHDVPDTEDFDFVGLILDLAEEVA